MALGNDKKGISAQNNGPTLHTDKTPQGGHHWVERIQIGAFAGFMGGSGFGVMISAAGKMDKIAALVGSHSIYIGWLVHQFIATSFGIIFSLMTRGRLRNWFRGIGAGIAYGIFWWILGDQLLMPTILREPIFQINNGAWWSLAGHIAYGVILGLLVFVIPSQPTGRGN